MTAQEFVSFPDRYIADITPNFGDGDSVLTLLYEAYDDANDMDSDDIKAGLPDSLGRISALGQLRTVSRTFVTRWLTVYDSCEPVPRKGECVWHPSNQDIIEPVS